MAYSKLYKAESDVPVGFQTINQLRTNTEVHRDALAAEHGTGVVPGVGGGGFLQPPWQLSPWSTLGKHNDERIARAVAYVSHDANGNPYLQWASPQFASVTHFSLGQYFLPVAGLTGYWAHACLYELTDPSDAYSTGNLGLMIQVRPYYPSGVGGSAGIFLQINRRVGGSIELADGIDFSVAIHGRLA